MKKLKENNRHFMFFDFETTGIDYEFSLPIQIGYILVDPKGKVTKTNQFYIWPYDYAKTSLDEDELVPYNKAKEVHGIEFNILRSEGLSLSQAKEAILEDVKDTRYTLISNNAVFDTHYMSIIFGGLNDLFKTFHYSVWDTSSLLSQFELLSLGDRGKHQALDDVLRIYKNYKLAVGKAERIK